MAAAATTTPLADPSTRALMARLWREELARHRGRILAALPCTLALSAVTALYPIVIQQAFDRFGHNDPDVVWLLPPVIIAVTSARAASLYGQQLAVQGTVLRVIEGLQRRLFAALTRADLAVAAADAPARHAARFTTDAAAIREALSRAIAGVANVLTIIGLVGSMLWLDWAMALLAALLYRRRTGRGQFIDLAQFESTANFAGPYLLEYLATGVAQQPDGNHAREVAPHNAYRCADDADGGERWCVIAVESDAEWQALCTALGDPAWARDPRYASLAGRKAHEEELDGKIAAWTAERSPEEVMALLQAHGVAAGVVQDGRDLLDRDPHLRERGYFFTMDHPEMGPSRYHRLAFTLSATPARFRPAPLLGQHNHYVLSTLLGLSDAEIERYEREGVLE
jgi:ABC-type multidrug transport system fused ATPase/permease subunit